MKNQKLNSLHAPADRASKEILKRQEKEFDSALFLKMVSDSIPHILVILNKQRQIVFANKRFYEVCSIESWEKTKGKRPGEVLNCVHASESKGGCGTTEFCRVCGAVNAILESQTGIQSIKECRILTSTDDAIDLKVWATPYTRNEELYTILAIEEVGNEKRRQALERTFFHDVLNSAGGILGLAGIITEEEDPKEIEVILNMIMNSSKRLIEEIQSQRQLCIAERDELELSLSEFSSIVLLYEVVETYLEHEVSQNKRIIIDSKSKDSLIITDRVLARRVVGNMLKNALEATTSGGSVNLECYEENNSVICSVHSSAHMSREIQLQIFQRSFSTKGSGRGIGTYSMKLLGEKFLGGSVYFESNEEKGTTFFLKLPKVHETSK